MACVTSSSRTFFAFSRDRAIPGWKTWSAVGAKGVPVKAVLGSSMAALLFTLPALPGKGTFVPPVALIAITSIGTIGLYIAYVAPVWLRWRAGDSFKPGTWTLGARYKWINPIAVAFVVLMVIVLCYPFYSTGVPWESDFDWNAFNYTPLVVGIAFLGIWLAWILGANKRYTGPIRQIEFDEGMGIKEIDEPTEPPPPAAAPPGAPA
jgi:amino acid transporter